MQAQEEVVTSYLEFRRGFMNGLLSQITSALIPEILRVSLNNMSENNKERNSPKGSLRS